MTAGRVCFVGCGPGAADLLTLRAVRAIGGADIVVWSPTLLDEAVVVEHARRDAELVAWPPARQREILALYDRAAAEGLDVVRLKGGDPTLFGELGDDLAAVRARGLDAEIVPGVSAVTAAAAALGCELVAPGTPLALVAAGTGAAGGGGAVAVLNAGSDPAAVSAALDGCGLPASTPCGVVVGVSRPGEIVVTCALAELPETLRDYGAAGLTIVLAGAGLGDRPQASGSRFEH
jgi:precorrin-4 methylase